jgi:glucose/arabinose dehydrogenase
MRVRRPLVRRIAIGGAAAIAVVVVAVFFRDASPDYDAIRGCTLPEAVPAVPVEQVAAPVEGVQLTPVADVERATVLLAWPDGSRVLVANRDGFVWLLDPASGVLSQVLDLSERIRLNAEGGIVGGALAPDGAHLYLHHTDVDGTSRILELATGPDGLLPASEREVLSLPHPALVHNGGAMAFGPDGYLYLGFGDGGGRPEDADRVASLEHLDGKLLRIDPRAGDGSGYEVPGDNPFADVADVDDARPEIWATGMRNPYRFAFDPATSELWVADVGEACYEEINVLEAGAAGVDLGFPRFEGNHEFLGGDVEGAQFPVLTYSHDEGCAVIGGVVTSDPRVPDLGGRFLFSDYCTGGLHWVRQGTDAAQRGTVGVEVEGVQSFGTGPAGETYVLTAQQVLRLDPVG